MMVRYLSQIEALYARLMGRKITMDLLDITDAACHVIATLPEPEMASHLQSLTLPLMACLSSPDPDPTTFAGTLVYILSDLRALRRACSHTFPLDCHHRWVLGKQSFSVPSGHSDVPVLLAPCH